MGGNGANWRPSNHAVTAGLEMGVGEGGGDNAASIEGNDFLSSWYKPKWLKRVPNNLEDVSDDHRNLSMNWLWQEGFFIDCFNDCPSNKGSRIQAGWDGESQTIGILSGGKAWFPEERWPDFCRYYAHDLKINFGTLKADTKIKEQPSAGVPPPEVVVTTPPPPPPKPIYETVSRYPVFVNEVYKDKYIKIGLDLDFKGPKPESDKFLLAVARCLHLVVVSYYPKRKSAPRGIFLRTKTCRNDTWGIIQRCIKSRKKISQDCLYMRSGEAPMHESEPLFRFNMEQEEAKSAAENYVGSGEGDGKDAEKQKKLEEAALLLKPLYKVGMHPVWNVLINMDNEDVPQLVESMIFALEDKFGPRWDGYNSWRDVIDVEPIMKGMLRMVGSIKQTDCVICSRWADMQLTCPGCYGTGKFVDDRAYMPWVALAGSKGRQLPADVQRMYSDMNYMVSRCTMHAPAGKLPDEFIIPENAPIAPPRTSTFTRSVNFTDGSYGGSITTNEFAADFQNFNHKSLDLRTSDDRFKVLCRLIDRIMPEEYAKVKVSSIRLRMFRGALEYSIFVKGPGSHHCANIGRGHRSNHIMFAAGRDPNDRRQFMMWQKCLDQDCRKAKFISRGYAIPTLLFNMLFHKPLAEIKAARNAPPTSLPSSVTPAPALLPPATSASASTSAGNYSAPAVEAAPTAAAVGASSTQEKKEEEEGDAPPLQALDAEKRKREYEMSMDERALVQRCNALMGSGGLLAATSMKRQRI